MALGVAAFGTARGSDSAKGVAAGIADQWISSAGDAPSHEQGEGQDDHPEWNDALTAGGSTRDTFAQVASPARINGVRIEM